MAHEIFMPSADDFNALILGISYSLYDGLWLPVRATYDRFRPCGWPPARRLLLALNYAANAAGWREFMHDMLGMAVVTQNEARIISIAHRRPSPAMPPGPAWGDEMALTLYYEWPWSGARERQDARERGWL